jgi:hypothetical protein
MDLKLSFTDKEITPWSGIALLQQMLDQMNFDDALRQLELPAAGSNRGYAPAQLVKQFLTSVWCGANRFEHCEVTRHDEVMRQIWGFDRMASHKAFQRFFCKHTLALNQRLFTGLYQWFFQQLNFPTLTLDIDSTVLIRHGHQQGAARGYNPQRPGRNSHHPLMAFVAEINMVANFWLRSGNAYASNNVEAFVANTIERLQGRTIGLLRGDSGFFNARILDYLEQCAHCADYIIAVRLHKPYQQLICAQKTWLAVGGGAEVAETWHQAPGWPCARRIIMVRQKNTRTPKDAGGKALRLFADQQPYADYRYSCFVTTLKLSPVLVWKLYRQRATAENRIKELKYDFGASSFNLRDFAATEAALSWVMMAYNFISLFRHVVLQSSVNERMQTLRYQVFGVGGYIVKQGTQRFLKLSLAMKKREWFTGLWNQSKTFTLPVEYKS